MKIRILSLLTLLCSIFSFGTFAGTPTAVNTIKRVACMPGLPGCSPVSVTLKLNLPGTSTNRTKTFGPTDPGKTYETYLTEIHVTIGSGSSTGTHYLPTTIGDVAVISGVNSGGVSYNVYIKKTADKEFYLSAFESNY